MTTQSLKIKHALEGINETTETEEQVSELEDRMIKITAKEQKKEGKDLKTVSEISVTVLNTNIWIIGIPEEEASSLVAQMVKNLPAMWKTWVWFPGLGRSPGGYSNPLLPGETPWTEKPGRLQSMGSQRVGQNWVTKHSTEKEEKKKHMRKYFRKL